MKVLLNWTPRGGGVYSMELPLSDKPSKPEISAKPAPKQQKAK
jgi:hypothetical protein